MNSIEQKDYVKLGIFYTKMNEADDSGVIEITSTGYPTSFVYSSTGSANFIPESDITTDIPNMLAFGKEMKDLILKYFPNIPVANWSYK